MAEVKFYLDAQKNKDGTKKTTDVPIFLFYSFNKQRLKYYTGKKVDVKNYVNDYFKKDKQPVKATARGAENINKRLKLLKAHVENIHNNAIALSIVPNVSYFKTKLDEILKTNDEDQDKDYTVQDALKEYLLHVKKCMAFNTYRNSQTSVNHLTAFLDKKTKFESINSSLIDKFKDYLIEKGLLNNSVSKNLRVIRTFINWSKEKNYHSISDLKIHVQENDIDVIFLNYDELMHLYNLDLKSEALQRVRDVFIFGCLTGMRYSDIFKLKKDDIKGDQIKFFIKKGDHTTSQTVPLVTITKAILNKYKEYPGEKALPVIANQKMNEALKVIAKEAGFNEVITIAEKQGNGEIIEKQYPKYELITCHVSRKSFITVAMMRGMADTVVKSITGHSKNSKAFARYYDIVDSHKEAEMNKIF